MAGNGQLSGSAWREYTATAKVRAGRDGGARPTASPYTSQMALHPILMPLTGPDAPAPEHGQGSAGKLLSGEYQTTTWNHHTGENGRLFCGVWESTPGKVVIDYTEWEFCHLISGRIVLTAEDGVSWAFGPGDAFMIPAGFRGTWETVEAVRKHYVILTPAEENTHV